MFDVLISWAQRVAKRIHLLCKFRVLFLWCTLLLVRYPTVPPFQYINCLYYILYICIYFWHFTTSAELLIWELVLPANFHRVFVLIWVSGMETAYQIAISALVQWTLDELKTDDGCVRVEYFYFTLVWFMLFQWIRSYLLFMDLLFKIVEYYKEIRLIHGTNFINTRRFRKTISNISKTIIVRL